MIFKYVEICNNKLQSLCMNFACIREAELDGGGQNMQSEVDEEGDAHGTNIHASLLRHTA
jgi:hypothetical protein